MSGYVRFLAAGGCMLASIVAVAADDNGGAGINVGGLMAYPSAGLAVMSDDNIYLSNLRKQSSTIEVVSPGVKLETQRRDDIYSLAYRADLGRYNSASGNDYNDQSLKGQALVNITPKASLKVNPELVWSHDPIGTTYGFVVPGGFVQTTPNTWRNTGVSAIFSYGTDESKGKVELEGGYLGTKYTNNRNFTVGYDKKITDAGATFYYRVMPKTSLLFQAKDERIAYDNPAVAIVPNSTQQYYLVGAKWEATAKTTGDLRIGHVSKNYDASTAPKQNYSGIVWVGKVSWDAKTYSRVNLVLSKQPTETTLPGSAYMLVTSSTLGWDYDWSSRVTSHASYNQYLQNFGGIGLNTTANNYTLGVDYQMRRWLKTGISWMNTTQTVNQLPYEALMYDRNVFMLSLTGTL